MKIKTTIPNRPFFFQVVLLVSIVSDVTCIYELIRQDTCNFVCTRTHTFHLIRQLHVVYWQSLSLIISSFTQILWSRGFSWFFKSLHHETLMMILYSRPRKKMKKRQRTSLNKPTLYLHIINRLHNLYQENAHWFLNNTSLDLIKQKHIHNVRIEPGVKSLVHLT